MSIETMKWNSVSEEQMKSLRRQAKNEGCEVQFRLIEGRHWLYRGEIPLEIRRTMYFDINGHLLDNGHPDIRFALSVTVANDRVLETDVLIAA
jgi:hypothetical protein